MKKIHLILIGITLFFILLIGMQMAGVDVNSNKDVGMEMPPTATPTPNQLPGAIIECSSNDNVVNGKCVTK